MKVSFIVQNKDYGCYLPDCLKAIQSQNGINNVEYEIIGLDAGSKDDSRSVYQCLIGDYVDVTGLNQAQALNVALKMAKGKYIAWINSDDFYRNNFLKHYLSAFDKLHACKQNKQVSMICGLGIYLKDSALFKLKVKFASAYYLLRNPIRRTPQIIKMAQHSRLNPMFNISQPATLILRKWLKTVGGWNEQLTYVIDLELWCRLATISYFGFIPKVDTIIRSHDRRLGIVKHTEQEKEADMIRKRYQNVKFLGMIYAS